MHVILGGTGHAGSAAATALLALGEPVTIITRDAAKRGEWKRRGAELAVADVYDVGSLRSAFRQGRRLYLINPPADPTTDTDVEERETIANIVAALDGSGLEKIVVQSTYGARPGERCGDLATLHWLEQAVQARGMPASILRAAYFMSNWDSSLESARVEGVVRTLFPFDFELPMVAPQDLGAEAARLLTEPVERTRLQHVEGPARYSPSDVAAAFAHALGKPVRLAVAPRETWKQTFKSIGFSDAAAESYERMTAVTLDERYEPSDAPLLGETSLAEYIEQLVQRT
jgi:uncharacterized protein YbjT (DUF2867 family)